MDIHVPSVLIGVLGLLEYVQAAAQLRCIACEHIGWNETYTFNNVQYIYHLLQTKYNPACAQNNPRDRESVEVRKFHRFRELENERQKNAYEQSYQKQIEQQQQQHNIPKGQNYQQRYEIGEVLCSNQCTYVYGDVIVYFIPFSGTMTLNMHLRYCQNTLNHIRDGCFHRDTNSGYDVIKIKVQQILEFLGGAEVVEVVRFVGIQCYCSHDLCLSSSSDRNSEAFIVSLMTTLCVYFLIK